MGDIKQIAGTLQQNTREQGVVLMKADANMDDTKVNVIEAHNEIIEARGYQKESSKWTCYLIIALLVICGIVIISTVIATGKNKN